tara:strand:- start:110 stop:412 length:303 start_codon:yes stop_codon:yes gene_type:complete
LLISIHLQKSSITEKQNGIKHILHKKTAQTFCFDTESVRLSFTISHTLAHLASWQQNNLLNLSLGPIHETTTDLHRVLAAPGNWSDCSSPTPCHQRFDLD